MKSLWIYKILFIGLFSIFFFTPYFGLFPDFYRLKNVRIIDGDTIEADMGENNVHQRIRFIFIDAPELEQKSKEGIKIGLNSKISLTNFLSHRDIGAEIFGLDIYGRNLGRIFIFKKGKKYDIGVEMLKFGQAIPYTFKNTPPSSYMRANKKAKNNRLGIYGTQGFQSPYLYRRKMKSKRKGS